MCALKEKFFGVFLALIGMFITSSLCGQIDIDKKVYKDINNVAVIDFDLIKNQIQNNPIAVYIIIFRGEWSTDGDKIISPLNEQLKSNSPFIHISLHELEKAKFDNYYFKFRSNGRIDSAKAVPPRLWLITSDQNLTRLLKKEMKFINYKNDTSFLQLGQIDNPKSFYTQLDNIISICNVNNVVSILNKDISDLKSKMEEIKSPKITSNPIDNNISQNEIARLSKRIDELNDSLLSIKKLLNFDQHNFLSISWSPQLVDFSGLNKNEIDYNSSHINFLSFSANYVCYPESWKLSDNWQFGFGVDLGFNKTSFDLTYQHDIVDSVEGVTDVIGNNYTRFIYAKGIKETVMLSAVSVMPQISFRYLSDNKKWFLSFSPGVKFSTMLASSYQATNGSVSYGGYYPQYYGKDDVNHSHSKDTIFKGLFDFYQDTAVYSKEQHLQVKTEIISFYLPINFSYIFKDTWGFSLGFYYEIGLSNILNNDPKDNVVSTEPSNYNSLLYRSESIKLYSLGLKVGLTYKF